MVRGTRFSDFVADQLQDGRRFRALSIIDVFTRESRAKDNATTVISVREQ